MANRLTIRIEGEYGLNEGSIHIEDQNGTEMLMWESAEWSEDPSLVYVIANAITTALSDPDQFLRIAQN
ncbi:hypothetical protein BST46_27535 [Mycobacterium timonense]|uniref:Uncharacterized protein n=1 Tax=Mycobacterium timonense TaxID=701043 RepID=A0ABX3TDM0_9MYCO|nr:hypothetical protein BST46_27535 [Mycobacterium timonense]